MIYSILYILSISKFQKCSRDEQHQLSTIILKAKALQADENVDVNL